MHYKGHRRAANANTSRVLLYVVLHSPVFIFTREIAYFNELSMRQLCHLHEGETRQRERVREHFFKDLSPSRRCQETKKEGGGEREGMGEGEGECEV